MVYTFFNKNNKLFDFLYDDNKNAITEIIEVYNKRFFPVSLKDYDNLDNLLVRFSDWLGIRYSKNSKWFKKQTWEYGIINIQNTFIKSYGLSLSDQYWIKPKFAEEIWEDVNFFHNDFKYQPFISNNLERKYDYSDVDILYTPTITTGGEVDKAWTIDNNDRVLYKSSNTFLGLEPINEFISSKICEIIDISYVNYDIKILSNLDKKIMVSSCKTFINENTELITAAKLMNKDIIEKRIINFDSYLNILNELGIKDAKEKVKKMILLDLIMSNTDRHLNNFGVIRDVNTLEFIDVAPIYDTGRSLATDIPSMDLYNGEMILFGKEHARRSDGLNIIKGLKLTQEQIDRLKEIPNQYKSILEEYYKYTNLGFYKENLKEDIINLLTNNINEVINYLN